MVKWIPWVAAWPAILAGCAHSGPKAEVAPPPAQSRPVSEKPVFTAVTLVAGRVVVANATARFVVIDLEPGVVLAVDTRLFAYRNGVRVGELRVTGPQAEDKTVADIVAGDLRINDQISDR